MPPAFPGLLMPNVLPPLFGANAYELAAEMGHSDINTTLIYTHVPDAIPQSKLAFWQKKGMV